MDLVGNEVLPRVLSHNTDDEFRPFRVELEGVLWVDKW